MTKQSGMGDQFLIDGYDISGDSQSFSRIGGGHGTLDVTPINKFGMERIFGLIDGGMDFVTFFNDANSAPLGAFQVLKTLPTADRIQSYLHGSAVGGACASCVTKQANYDPTRAADGSFTFTVNSQANGFGLEWGEQLTAGKRTDTAGTNGGALDFGSVSTAFGWAAYLHVVALTGTNVVVTLQDSADNSSWANLTGGAFVSATAIGAQRLASAPLATVRRYVRAVSSGTFTSATFAVNFVRYLTVPS